MDFFTLDGRIMKISLSIVLLSVFAWFTFSWLSCDNGIYDYVPSRDKAAVKKMFHDDWQFLYYGDWDKITEDDFDVDFMLDNRSSSQYSAANNLVLKVLREQGKTIGFLAYHPKSTFWWHMLFLIVDVDHRRSGNASKLVQYFIDDSIARGALKVTTFTRVANVRARGLYEGKFKFKASPYEHNDKYIDLTLYPKK